MRSSTKRASPLGNALVHRGEASTVLASSRVHEPSGAAGAGVPNTSGFAETTGSCAWISMARRWRRGAYGAQLRWIARSWRAASAIEETRQLARIEPDVLRPGGGTRRPRRNQQPLRGEVDRPELLRQLGHEPVGGEIRGARRRGRVSQGRAAPTPSVFLRSICLVATISKIVIPAKAGIHCSTVQGAAGWIPAFAGMTPIGGQQQAWRGATVLPKYRDDDRR